MRAMLTLQRRHSQKCPDKKKGPNFLKCRGHCALRICDMVDGKRVRKSLKTRDLQRAVRRLAEMKEEALSRPRKALQEAIEAFHAQHAGHASETKRKYKRVLGFLLDYCTQQSLRYVDQVIVETMDGYNLWRNKENWTWIKEIEILRQFFAFCIEREWTSKNPAKALKRPRLLEANDEEPYTQDEIARMIAACDFIGRSSYERLRARAMVLLLRFAAPRISDVVTLSREHIKGNHLQKRAIKNNRWIRVKLPPVVLEALEALPHPKAAPKESQFFFAGGESSVRSLVKGAQRTLAAVFRLAKVDRAHPHRFRHTLASELLGKGRTTEEVAGILADSPATISRHYAKWTTEYQARQDQVNRISSWHRSGTGGGTDQQMLINEEFIVVARDGIEPPPPFQGCDQPRSAITNDKTRQGPAIHLACRRPAEPATRRSNAEVLDRQRHPVMRGSGTTNTLAPPTRPQDHSPNANQPRPRCHRSAPGLPKPVVPTLASPPEDVDRHRGGGHPPTPATPPCVRVRTRRFESVTLTFLEQ